MITRLAELGCEGTIIGKAIYEGRISLRNNWKIIIK
jgi:phosphoribosylformimino-5-aminoimidazole carboxamide ribotide isomerase